MSYIANIGALGAKPKKKTTQVFLKSYGVTGHELALKSQAETEHLVNAFLANSYEEVIIPAHGGAPVKHFKKA